MKSGGTSGKPKGVVRRAPRKPASPEVGMARTKSLRMLDPSQVHLVAAPLYHSAPMGMQAIVGEIFAGDIHCLF